MTQQDFLRHLVSVLEEMGVPYMIVGAYASSVLGEPRLTLDIDIVVKLMREDVVVFERAFTSPDYYFDAAAAREALSSRGMFNIIHPKSGNKADLIIAREDLWGRHQIYNRTRVRVLEDLDAFVARGEDVIIGKLLSYQEGGSEKHLRDVAGIVREARSPLDMAYIEHWAAEFNVGEAWALVLERLKSPG